MAQVFFNISLKQGCACRGFTRQLQAAMPALHTTGAQE
jgi:hypothetical protein